ncbi:Leucine-rich repeat-containing protein [Blastocladiella emersonii ATCC 22665]|nr:Leucine-rich repeat-containing protein [Blastocladiella emersonii ATCC 22665]
MQHIILDVDSILEEILCWAAWLHPDRGDLRGMLQYAHVLPRSRVPRVTRAVIRSAAQASKASGVSTEAATASGSVQLLDLIRASGLPLTWYMEMLNTALKRGHEDVLAWWRETGLVIKPANAEYSDPLYVALDLTKRPFVDHPDIVICPELNAGEKNPKTKELLANDSRMCSKGIAKLNRIMTMPMAANLVAVYLNCCHIRAQELSELRVPATVKRLVLNGNQFGLNLDALAADRDSFLPLGLKELRLIGCNMTLKSLSKLAPVLPPNLEFLDLSSNELDADGLELPTVLFPPGLKKLRLNECNFTPATAQLLTDHLPVSLEKLKLDETKLSSDFVGSLARNLPRLSNLRKLLVNMCSLSSTDAARLIASLPDSLETLDLSYNTIQGEAAQAFATRALPRLQKLTIDRTHIGGAQFVTLSSGFPSTLVALSCLGNGDVRLRDVYEMLQTVGGTIANLESLAVGPFDQGDDFDVAAIREVLPPSIIKLALTGCKFYPQTIRSILAALPADRVVELDFSEGRFQRTALTPLAEWLPQARSLEFLNLASCKLANRHIAQLAPSLLLAQSLRYLSLMSNTDLSDAAVDLIASNWPEDRPLDVQTDDIWFSATARAQLNKLGRGVPSE